jgi:thioredoxin-like negative regulator of GroEL
LSNNFDFVSVTLNPWRQFFESADGKALVDFQQAQGFALSGVPSVMIFANDQPIRMLPGGNPTLISTLEEVFEAISDQELVVRGDVSVANIPASQIETYVNAFSEDRPLLLTLSSTDKNCMHCKTGNDAIDDVSRYLADDFIFARTDFDPWQSVDDDIEVKAFFSLHGENLVGLPTSFLFYRGKLLSRVITNGPDLKILLPQTLPLIAGLD